MANPQTPHGRKKITQPRDTHVIYIAYRHIITNTQLKNQINAAQKTLKVLIHKEYYTPKELLNSLKIKKKRTINIHFLTKQHLRRKKNLYKLLNTIIANIQRILYTKRTIIEFTKN